MNAAFVQQRGFTNTLAMVSNLSNKRDALLQEPLHTMHYYFLCHLLPSFTLSKHVASVFAATIATPLQILLPSVSVTSKRPSKCQRQAPLS